MKRELKPKTNTSDSPNSMISYLQHLSLLLDEVGLTLFVFGLLVWGYVVSIQVTNPNWLSAPLTHYPLPPFNWRVDDLGVLGFAISAFVFSFGGWQTRNAIEWVEDNSFTL